MTISIPSFDDLKAKSEESAKIIASLKAKIEQIKLESTPEFIADKVAKLKAENEQLKAKVQTLKNDVESHMAQNISNTKIVAAEPVAVAQEKTFLFNDTATTEKSEKPKAAANKKAPAKKEELTAADVDISKLDIRIGRIMEVARHPEAEKLYVEQIDLGEGKLRTVCSGLVEHIPIEQMRDRLVVCVCNLKPAKLRGVLSEAMVLCASTPEAVELLDVPSGAQVGDRVTAAGFEGAHAVECNPKNNIFGLVCPDLRTNDSRVATYKGVVLEVIGKGPLTSPTLKGAPVK